MRLTRVHLQLPLASGASIGLPDSAAQHLTRVLRLGVGAPLVLFNGQGGEYQATIEAVHRGGVVARIGAHDPVERESPLSVSLLQGIARGEKMDLILQKATELGVSRIVPLTSARSSVRLTGETARRKQTHWHGIVASACEQCGRNRVPEVDAPVDLAGAVQAASGELKLLLAPEEEADSLQSIWARHAARDRLPSVALLVGPEGGFDTDEVRAAMQAGFAGCRLGPRVLRTETAALATLAALQFAGGGFNWS